MEILNRIIEQVKVKQKSNSMTSQNLNKYKCNKCKDLGWIKGKNGYRRCECYKRQRTERLWRSFGIDPNNVKNINGYIPYDALTNKAKTKAIEYIKHFNNIKSTKTNSFGLFGQPGSGKSHIVIAIGAALIKKNIQVVYMPYVQVIRQLVAATFNNEYFIKCSEKFQKAELLVIDDLFKDKIKNRGLIKDRYGNTLGLTKQEMDSIYPIINYRYLNQLPTLFSTECTPNMLVELDEALTGRIIEPCGSNIVVFGSNKNDYRLRKFLKTEA